MEKPQIIHVHHETETKKSGKKTPLVRMYLVGAVIYLIAILAILIYTAMKELERKYGTISRLSRNLFGVRILSIDDGMHQPNIQLDRYPPIQVKLKRIQPVQDQYVDIPQIPQKVEKEEEEEQDDKKIGIYTVKEAKREFKWFKNLESVDFVFPDITKKLKKQNKGEPDWTKFDTNDKKDASYTETTFAKRGRLTSKALKMFGYFPIPLENIKKGKIIAFTGSEVIIDFGKKKPTFGIVIPISENLYFKVQNDELEQKALFSEVPYVEESKNETIVKEPLLFRSNSSIRIHQKDSNAKQFVLLTLY
jgi:hypothetical protein